MEMTGKTFPIWANHLPKDTTDSDVVRHSLLLVPDPFFMLYENDERYFPEVEALEGEKLRIEETSNVWFYQSDSLSSAASIRSYKLLFAGPCET